MRFLNDVVGKKAVDAKEHFIMVTSHLFPQCLKIVEICTCHVCWMDAVWLKFQTLTLKATKLKFKSVRRLASAGCLAKLLLLPAKFPLSWGKDW